ncbi:DUF5677 domain-containing protein [Priestia megaterium]
MQNIGNQDIKTIRDELYVMVGDVYDIMNYLEKHEKFHNQIDVNLKKYFYHLYLKCKRNFKAIEVLIEADELDNGYVESVVLLRVMAEAYLHLCYLIKNDRNKILEEYQILSDFKLEKMLNQGNRFKYSSGKDIKELKKLRGKIARDIKLPEHFESMRILAKQTGNIAIYNGIYEMFNTYVHFSPATYVSYGSDDGSGNFTFNSLKPRPFLEARIIYYSVTVQMLLFVGIFNYLDIKKVPSFIVESINNWTTFRDTKSKIILENTDDYI